MSSGYKISVTDGKFVVSVPESRAWIWVIPCPGHDQWSFQYPMRHTIIRSHKLRCWLLKYPYLFGIWLTERQGHVKSQRDREMHSTHRSCAFDFLWDVIMSLCNIDPGLPSPLSVLESGIVFILPLTLNSMRHFIIRSILSRREHMNANLKRNWIDMLVLSKFAQLNETTLVATSSCPEH